MEDQQAAFGKEEKDSTHSELSLTNNRKDSAPHHQENLQSNESVITTSESSDKGLEKPTDITVDSIREVSNQTHSQEIIQPDNKTDIQDIENTDVHVIQESGSNLHNESGNNSEHIHATKESESSSNCESELKFDLNVAGTYQEIKDGVDFVDESEEQSIAQPGPSVDRSIIDRIEVEDVDTNDPAAKKTKLDTEVILIDENNSDSRQSMATDDDVILVDEREGKGTANVKASTSQDALLYDFSRSPRMITGAWKCFETSNHDNYLRGCKWAPDGTCLLTNSNDNCLRLFNLPEEMYLEGGENKDIAEMVPVLKMKEADTIYDFCWYPQMSSANPETACLAVTCKDTPIHLYDAFTGELRCSYRAFNHVDEVAPAYSLSFNSEGSKLYCGFNKMIRVFDVTRPGRDCEDRPTFAKQGQPGIISCIAPSPTEPGLYAAGSYARAIALYQVPKGEMICMFQGQQGGVTQLAFSPDGTKLYSGGRKDPEILCWDMRNPGQILFSLIRRVETNQRIYFDQTMDGRYLISGSHDGDVLVWDTLAPPAMLYPESDPVLKPVSVFPAHNDTVNGVSLHPSLPLIATSSGQRHFPDVYDSDDSDEGENDNDNVVDNSLKLWWL